MPPLVDISVPLDDRLPVWPTSSGFSVRRDAALEAGDPANVSRLETDVHCGTHVDAPLHFVGDGQAVDELSLDTLVGHATLADLTDVSDVTSEALEGLGLDAGVERLLLKTRNSAMWHEGDGRFNPGYAAVTRGAAEWLVERRLRLVGIDYLSVEPYDQGFATHRALLGAGMTILEGIDLSGVKPGDYELTCLPLRLTGAEAAPARATLREVRYA
jgi:arylformamidase